MNKVEEFENNIHYAMEYHLPICFRLHNKGKPLEICLHTSNHERSTHSEER